LKNTKQITDMNKENQDKIVDEMNKVIEDVKGAILAGTPIKNIKKLLVNSGFSEKVTEKICKVAKFEVVEFLN